MNYIESNRNNFTKSRRKPIVYDNGLVQAGSDIKELLNFLDLFYVLYNTIFGWLLKFQEWRSFLEYLQFAF